MSSFPLVSPGSLPWLTVAQMREVDRVLVEELGISLIRMMENAGGAAALIRQAAGRRVLALDAPSGLELETSRLREPHVWAEATLALACPKEGLCAAGAEGAVGALYLADSSAPAQVYERIGAPYTTPFGSSAIVRIET